MPLFKKLKKDIEDEQEEMKETPEETKEEQKQPEENKEKLEENKQKSPKEDLTQKKENWMELEGQLAVDAFEQDDKFVVEAPIAGVTPEDLEVFVEEETLIIRGTRRRPTTQENRKYFYQECYWGEFAREIALPEDVDSSKIKARFENSILTIEIPKITAKKRKRINITIED